MWKHYIVLFGGFYDLGINSKSAPSLTSQHETIQKTTSSALSQRLVGLRYAGIFVETGNAQGYGAETLVSALAQFKMVLLLAAILKCFYEIVREVGFLSCLVRKASFCMVCLPPHL